MEDRINSLKEAYEQRLKNIQDQMHNIYKNIQTDHIVNAMKEDATSTKFISDRVKVS
jgi:hypothetical protein